MQECPEGVVHEDCFKDIYAKFFPHGSKFYQTDSNCIRLPLEIENNKMLFGIRLTPDSSIYAHYVFKAFDVNSNGAISFRVSVLHPVEFDQKFPFTHKHQKFSF